jgi:iron(III) transport system ATP-binding protein
MSDAAIAQTGTPRELYEAPASRFVADFIGNANVIDAELLAWCGERAVVRLCDGLELSLSHRGVPPGPAKLAIRPEGPRLHRAKPAEPTIAGRVFRAVYLGSHMEYVVECPLGSLFIVDRITSDSYPIGSEVWLGFGDSGIALLPT